MTHADLDQQLTCLVNTHGLTGVLDALSDICDSNARRTAHDWQDVNLGKRWAEHASLISRLAAQIAAAPLPPLLLHGRT